VHQDVLHRPSAWRQRLQVIDQLHVQRLAGLDIRLDTSTRRPRTPHGIRDAGHEHG
jgi:hypothetical protein